MTKGFLGNLEIDAGEAINILDRLRNEEHVDKSLAVKSIERHMADIASLQRELASTADDAQAGQLLGRIGMEYYFIFLKTPPFVKERRQADFRDSLEAFYVAATRGKSAEAAFYVAQLSGEYRDAGLPMLTLGGRQIDAAFALDHYLLACDLLYQAEIDSGSSPQAPPQPWLLGSIMRGIRGALDEQGRVDEFAKIRLAIKDKYKGTQLGTTLATNY
jgi:hypothetical protein